MRRSFRSWTCSTWRRDGLGGGSQQPPTPTGKGPRSWRQALHSSAWWEETSYGQKLKEERFRQEIRRPFSPGGQGWAGVWVAQGGCASSIRGGFQALTAHGPERPGRPEREAVLETS